MLTQNMTPEFSKLEADLCYAFVDETRIRILYALNECPRNVTELTRQLDSHQPKISRHLKVLRNLGLVVTRRQGVNVNYELADARLIDVLDILRDVLRDHITGKAVMIDKAI
ncbi:MAG: ArsR/SmtB family transcription factor [Chloroflexota bacterium]|jgi:ArsR family transcriptional regulator